MRVLEIGAGGHPRTIQEYGRKNVTILDARMDEYTDVQHAVTPRNTLPFEDESFDVVFNSHVFEHMPYRADLRIMRDWVRVLKVGGSMHTIVPSWEWVAREVLKSPDKRSPAIRGMAFAGQVDEWDVHYNMFTLDMLEDIYKRSGLTVRTCAERKNVVTVHGQSHRTAENFIVGLRI